MYEKVSPAHPDKKADIIAGAIVDLAYMKRNTPRIAVEVLIGHGEANIIIESDVLFIKKEIKEIVDRILGRNVKLNYLLVPQDTFLAKNQSEAPRCGDNGIFRGVPSNDEEKFLAKLTKFLYKKYPYDGKYLIDGGKLIICQSHVKNDILKTEVEEFIKENKYNIKTLIINPLGEWSGGYNVDCGATNRKIGSDMGRAATGGGLHGKDLSKGDITLNIYAQMLAEKTGKPIEFSCAIGDSEVNGVPYKTIIRQAQDYICDVGGFEKLAMYGFIQ